MPTPEQIAFLARNNIRPVFDDHGKWDGRTLSIGQGTMLDALWTLVKTGHFNELRRCKFPGCPNAGSEGHHVTYEPPVIFPLCKGCHRDITVVNVNAGAKQRRQLTNKQRWFLWFQWTQGKLKPVYDENADRWLATWKG